MLKAYVYTPQELGLEKFSDGILRLNAETVTDPDKADVFVCPEPLFKFTNPNDLSYGPHNRFNYIVNQIGAIGYAREAPHVFFDLSEHFTTYTINTPIFIRAALTRTMLEWGPNSISWPWPAKDYKDCIDLTITGFGADITFHGWLSGLARKVATKACQKSRLIVSDIQTYTSFYGYQTAEEQTKREYLYCNGLRNSRMALTVESIPGVIPYRFYEAMSAGRCQLYVGANYVLPFADEIPYNRFVSFLNTDSADEADSAVHNWLNGCPDSVLVERGLEARYYWEKYLRPDNWVAMLTYAVEKKLEQMGLYKRNPANPNPSCASSP